MEVVLTLKDLGFILIVTCVVVLLIYCINLVRNLVTTIKHTNKILADTQVITEIAAERTKEVNDSVGELATAVTGIADAIKGNQSIAAAGSSLVNSVTSLKNIIAKFHKEQKDQDDIPNIDNE